MNRAVRLSQDVHSEIFDLLMQVPNLKEEGVLEVHLDCTEVNFMDSMVIGQVVRLHLSLEREGMKLHLQRLSPDVQRTFNYSGVGELLGLAAPEPPKFEPPKF